jgi:hypothetical protein
VASTVPLALLIIGAASAQSALPDPARTPGALNPAVTQETIGQTICVGGWTRTIRPPAQYTSALKRRQIRDWGYADQRMADFEEDHLIALGLGGSPDDPRNLWPEPRESSDGWTADRKDELENQLNHLVCERRVRLADAQLAISHDWTAAYRRYVGERSTQGSPPPSQPHSASRLSPNAGKQCHGDVLVWVNSRSGAYHYPGTPYYGTTKNGHFMCEKDAVAEGDHSASSRQ